MTSGSAGIPAWIGTGVLPPIRPSELGHSSDRSPYRVNLAMLMDQFATSLERVAILDGLLRFRAELHAAGINSGFQWLDGSFFEQVEVLEGRAPRDMDVVTFLDIPADHNQASMVLNYPDLFDSAQVKKNYSMDSYFVVLGDPIDAESIRRVSYWYSMWSHRRDGLWKGFIQVDLDPSQDGDARALLNLAGGAS